MFGLTIGIKIVLDLLFSQKDADIPPPKEILHFILQTSFPILQTVREFTVIGFVISMSVLFDVEPRTCYAHYHSLSVIKPYRSFSAPIYSLSEHEGLIWEKWQFLDDYVNVENVWTGYEYSCRVFSVQGLIFKLYLDTAPIPSTQRQVAWDEGPFRDA